MDAIQKRACVEVAIAALWSVGLMLLGAGIYAAVRP
jgi:hypothetical protein